MTMSLILIGAGSREDRGVRPFADLGPWIARAVAFSREGARRIVRATVAVENASIGGGPGDRRGGPRAWQPGVMMARTTSTIAAGATGTVEFYTDAHAGTPSGRTASDVKNICGADATTGKILFVAYHGGKLAIIGWTPCS